ncbi:MAG: hypothetical protein WDM86_11725 [Rhizomicrobium sp.]
MRLGFAIPFIVVTAFAGRAAAAQLVMPQDKPVYYNAYDTPGIAQPWVGQQPDGRLTEQPIGELIAVRLGLAHGRAELFSYRLENAPSAKTMLDGVIDGGGLKLKLTW